MNRGFFMDANKHFLKYLLDRPRDGGSFNCDSSVYSTSTNLCRSEMNSRGPVCEVCCVLWHGWVRWRREGHPYLGRQPQLIIKQIFIMYLLSVRHCIRCEKDNSRKTDMVLFLMSLVDWWGIETNEEKIAVCVNWSCNGREQSLLRGQIGPAGSGNHPCTA